MRTRTQIAKIIYDNLSDAKWSKLRDALNGNELVYLAAELAYIYEQKFRGRASWYVTQSREEIKTTWVNTIPSSIPRGPVFDALVTWGVECIYQCQASITKDYKDSKWQTATSYSAFLDLVAKPEYQFPILRMRPASIIVQLPAGSHTYMPYEIAIQAGSAVFYNIISYSSGDQAILFQGIPYSYNHNTDVSGYSACSEFTADLRICGSELSSTNFSRYISLPVNTLPASVEMFSVNNSFSRWTNLYPDANSFKLYNLKNNELALFLSDASWNQGFVSDKEDWCVRFLQLTNIEFDSASINLPEGYILLTTQNAVEDDLEYTRQVFAKYFLTSSSNTYNNDLIRLFCLSFPGVLDCNIIAHDNYNYSVYVKPTNEANNIIFTELEDSLKAVFPYLNFTTYCANYLQFMFILSADVTLSVRTQIDAYLREKYAYSNMLFCDFVTSEAVKRDLVEKFELDPNTTDVSVRIKHSIDSMEWTDGLYAGHHYEEGSISIYTPAGQLVGWDDAATHKIYCIKDTASGTISMPPQFVLSSATAYEKGTTTSTGYDFRTHMRNSSVNVTNMYDHAIHLGGNCGFALRDNGTTGTLYIYPLNSDYFKNTGVTWNPEDAQYAHTIDGELLDILKEALDSDNYPITPNSPFLAWDGVSTAYFAICTQSTGYAPTIFILDLALPTITRSSAISHVIPVSSDITSVIYWEGDVYVVSDDSTILRLHGLKLASWSATNPRHCKSFKLQDSYGNIIGDYSNVPWKFTDYPNFFAYVGSTGDIQVIALDPEDPGIDYPSDMPDWVNKFIDYAGAPEVTYEGNALYYCPDIIRRRCNSKWRVYSAKRFKETSLGLELVNLVEQTTIPSYMGYYKAYDVNGKIYSNTLGHSNMSLVIPLFGPVISGGVNGSIFSFGQAAYRFLEGSINHHTFHDHVAAGMWIYDTTTQHTTTPSREFAQKLTSIEQSSMLVFIPIHEPFEVGTYTHGSLSVAKTTLSNGYPLGKTFAAELSCACHSNDRYIKLDETLNIVWVS